LSNQEGLFIERGYIFAKEMIPPAAIL